jgi:hypothetical protein
MRLWFRKKEEELKEELKERKEQAHAQKVKELATRLKKAYAYLLQVRQDLATANEAFLDAQAKNLERKIKGEPEEDLTPLQNKIRSLEKKEEEAERLVRLLETEAKRIDPKFFDFI